jgi:hypothetical protein
MKMREIAAKRDSHEFISDTAVTPVEVTILSIQFPLLCVIRFVCLYVMFVSTSSIGKGKDGRCHVLLLPLNASPIYFTYKCSSTEFCVTYTVNCYTDDIPPPPDICE